MKALILEPPFNKVVGLKVQNEIPAQTFSCKYCEFLRTSNLKNICERLLLQFIGKTRQTI